jgi:drug/metabolite transporter (DMT)-like permease
VRLSPSIRGALFGLGAAALFGVSAPLSKRLLEELSPLMLAALLYSGGGLGLSLVRLVVRRPPGEARLGLSDARLLVPLIVSGGIIAPVLMLFGLSRLSGVSTSLLLNLEGPFTILLAVLVFKERLGRREWLAAALVLTAAAALGYQAWEWKGDLNGALCVAGACACWALDNNLSQRLSVKDPLAVVRVKTLGAGSSMLLIALAVGQTMPSTKNLLTAMGIGGVSYGASILLDLYALRLLGAAREAAYFATAPFIGALAAVPILNERLSWMDLGAGAVMAVGIGLLINERHGASHAHPAVEHAHLHTHGDGHHTHAHQGPVIEPHSHPHRHVALTHDHPHGADVHHRHADGDQR